MNYKKGDIVATNSGDYVMIIKKQLSYDCAEIITICNKRKAYFCSRGWFNRLATTEEKKLLFRLLLDKGYTWDEEKLELIQEL